MTYMRMIIATVANRMIVVTNMKMMVMEMMLAMTHMEMADMKMLITVTDMKAMIVLSVIIGISTIVNCAILG